MHARDPRQWLAAVPLTGRFYILFGILLLSVAGVLIGALRATQLQSSASTDLAHVAAVQRSLDRALTIHTAIAAEIASGGNHPQNLLNTLRTQLAALRRLLKVTPVNTVVIRRRLAEATTAKGGYIF